jgi:hypothetical protein
MKSLQLHDLTNMCFRCWRYVVVSPENYIELYRVFREVGT